MEPSENQIVAAFDTLYTSNHIQILKVLLPWFDAKSRKNMAVMIKFMELQYTMDYCQNHAPALDAASFETEGTAGRQPDIIEIFDQIRHFCTPSERAVIDQIASLKKNMELYQDMKNMMQMFEQLTPQETASASDDRFAPNPMELLKSMLSPEQSAMFDLFSASFQNNKED